MIAMCPTSDFSHPTCLVSLAKEGLASPGTQTWCITSELANTLSCLFVHVTPTLPLTLPLPPPPPPPSPPAPPLTYPEEYVHDYLGGGGAGGPADGGHQVPGGRVVLYIPFLRTI